MKIALIAPPWLSVPPVGYGGTEIIVHHLTEGLVKCGHEVTLFASGDSKTSAKLVSVFPKALGNSGEIKSDPLKPLLSYIDCFERAGEFDVIHNHAQYYAMFLAGLVKTPVVHTLHGSFAKEYTPEGKILTLRRFKNNNFVSISNFQRNDMPDLNYIATVYNGIDTSEIEFSDKKGDYLFWMGRITEKKGPVDAIKVAKKLGMRLKMAAVIDSNQEDYFEKEVKPLIDNKLITFEGEVTRKGKSDLLKNAFCTLFPIHWEEPFGLVMAESMAGGTPVIAYDRGSVREVVKDKKTGFIVEEGEGIEGLAEAVKKIDKINRQECRDYVEENFSVGKMVDGYEKVYSSLVRNIKSGL